MCASHDAHADSLCIVMSCQPPTGLRRMRRNRSATQMSGSKEQCFLSICCYCVSPPPPHGTNSRSLRAGTVCGHDCLCRLPVSHDFRSCLPVGLYMSAHVPIPRHGFPDLLFLCGISDECIFYLMTVTFVSFFVLASRGDTPYYALLPFQGEGREPSYTRGVTPGYVPVALSGRSLCGRISSLP